MGEYLKLVEETLKEWHSKAPYGRAAGGAPRGDEYAPGGWRHEERNDDSGYKEPTEPKSAKHAWKLHYDAKKSGDTAAATRYKEHALRLGGK